MSSPFKQQVPAIIVTGLVIAGAAYFLHQHSINALNEQQEKRLQEQKQVFDAQLKANTEETQKQIADLNKLLKDAIQKRSSDLFMTDDEIAKANDAKMSKFAEVVAQKIQPNLPLPKTPEEAEAIQNEQVDKISSRMAIRIQPILAEMSKDQNLTREQIVAYSQKISDQVGVVLTQEMARNQMLNNNLMATQSVARESLALSHEITALYLSSFKDQGLVTRLLSLPANVVRDVSKLSIVNSSDRKKIEQDLVNKMNTIDKRLKDLEEQQPKK